MKKSLSRADLSKLATTPRGGSHPKRCTRKRQGHPKPTLIVDIRRLILDPKCGCWIRKRTLFVVVMYTDVFLPGKDRVMLNLRLLRPELRTICNEDGDIK